MRYQLSINEQQFAVEIGEVAAGYVQVSVNGRPYTVFIGPAEAPAPAVPAPAPQRPAPAPPVAVPRAPVPAAPKAALPVPPKAPPAAAPKPASVAGAGTVTAPIPGLILRINVAAGDAVTAGQTVAVMEAMKMENNLTCAVSGTVQEIRVQKGSEVATGDVIMIIA